MQGRQLARGSALSSCFAKKKSRVRGPTRPPLDRASRCAARQLRVLKHPRQIRAPRISFKFFPLPPPPPEQTQRAEAGGEEWECGGNWYFRI